MRGGLWVPLVPADEYADLTEGGVEALVASIAGCEVEFFLKAWVLRDVGFAVATEVGAV